MKKFEIPIREINYGSVTVKANSLQEAVEQVKKDYENGFITWGDVEWAKTEFEFGEEREEN